MVAAGDCTSDGSMGNFAPAATQAEPPAHAREPVRWTVLVHAYCCEHRLSVREEEIIANAVMDPLDSNLREDHPSLAEGSGRGHSAYGAARIPDATPPRYLSARLRALVL
jgi:hypothetical protein